MLTEFRDKFFHYFTDENGIKNGEYKAFWNDTQLYVHSFCVNDQYHGEYKRWDIKGNLEQHCFIIHNKGDISFDEIPLPTTPEELMLFKLKYDLNLLPDTIASCVIIAAS